MPTAVSIGFDDLRGVLCQTIGEENAGAYIRDTASSLGLPTEGPWELDDAMNVLERLAKEPGLVGITARFAKSRLHLVAAKKRAQETS